MRLIEIDSGKYESESLKINHRDIEEIIAEKEEKAREEFVQVIALGIANCKTCPIGCEEATLKECKERLIIYAKEMNGEKE